MSLVLGIDPGPVETAFALVDASYRVIRADKVPTDAVLEAIRTSPPGVVAIESIQSYGMAVGQSVFQTCYAIGRIQQRCKDHGVPFAMYPRPEYARRICGVGKISDAIVRQALCLRFGGDAKGEPLNLLKGNSDKRSAFAVAVYHLDLLHHGRSAA